MCAMLMDPAGGRPSSKNDWRSLRCRESSFMCVSRIRRVSDAHTSAHPTSLTRRRAWSACHAVRPLLERASPFSLGPLRLLTARVTVTLFQLL